MAFSGKIVLFVEGTAAPARGEGDPFDRIWRRHLVESLNLKPVDRVVGISKKDLLAMDVAEVAGKSVSGVGAIPLDQRIAREHQRNPFDVAVIAWDLEPKWDKSTAYCQVQEMRRLYAGLARSEVLDEPWKGWIANRLEAMDNQIPRQSPPPLERGAILSLCMEPTFEALLLACETLIFRLLNLEGSNRPRSWTPGGNQKPEEFLQDAILRAKRLSPKPEPIKRVPGDMRTAKNEWGEYLLRRLVEDATCRQKLAGHKIPQRLSSLLHSSR